MRPTRPALQRAPLRWRRRQVENRHHARDPALDTAAASQMADSDWREFTSQADFEKGARTHLRRAGISLHTGKQGHGVQPPLPAPSRDPPHRLFQLSGLAAASGRRGRRWPSGRNCLTTNLTSFFRERHHFTALAADLRAGASGRNAAHLVQRGCSTGEEPYSIAMVVARRWARAQPSGTKILQRHRHKVLAHGPARVYDAKSRGLSASARNATSCAAGAPTTASSA